MAGMILPMTQTDFLQLNGGVANLETATHDVAELLQNLMPVIVAANNSVTAHGMGSRSQCPDMQIVDRGHPFDTV